MQQKQYNLLLKITCAFWILAKLMSADAWQAERLFPVIPVFEALDAVPPFIHTLLFYLSIPALALLFVFPTNRLLLFTVLVVEVCSCLLDVIRWQPWEYQYLFIIVILILNHHNTKAGLTAVAFLMVSIYIFSGLHKVNGGFLHSVWDSMILRRFFTVPNTLIKQPWLHYAGLLLPLLEIVLGFALLLLKNKRIPALLLIGIHLFILLLLGPLGLNYNSIVWPWNCAMILFLYVMFCRRDAQFTFSLMWKGWNRAILLFWGILPILSFAGYWDYYLSSSLYSGNTPKLAICIKDAKAAKGLEEYFAKKDGFKICNGDAMITLQNWALKEINVPPYPEERYYRKVKQKWEQKFPKANARFIVYAYPYKEKKELR